MNAFGALEAAIKSSLAFCSSQEQACAFLCAQNQEHGITLSLRNICEEKQEPCYSQTVFWDLFAHYTRGVKRETYGPDVFPESNFFGLFMIMLSQCVLLYLEVMNKICTFFPSVVCMWKESASFWPFSAGTLNTVRPTTLTHPSHGHHKITSKHAWNIMSCHQNRHENVKSSLEDFPSLLFPRWHLEDKSWREYTFRICLWSF